MTTFTTPLQRSPARAAIRALTRMPEPDVLPALLAQATLAPAQAAAAQALALRIAGVDLQPCGGTHVRNIGEIGAIRVVRVRNEGKHNRRVEIVVQGQSATP